MAIILALNYWIIHIHLKITVVFILYVTHMLHVWNI